jgi:hypothetical protein
MNVARRSDGAPRPGPVIQPTSLVGPIRATTSFTIPHPVVRPPVIARKRRSKPAIDQLTTARGISPETVEQHGGNIHYLRARVSQSGARLE